MGKAIFTADGNFLSWSRHDTPSHDQGDTIVECDEPPAKWSRLVDGEIVPPTSEEVAERESLARAAEAAAILASPDPIPQAVRLVLLKFGRCLNRRLVSLGQEPITEAEVLNEPLS